MSFAITIRHIDTCLSCYVLNHCNGEDEALIGVPVSKASRVHHVLAELISEARNCSKVPDEMSSDDIERACRDAFEGTHPLKTWDRTLEPTSDEDTSELCYSWFRMTWTDESDLPVTLQDDGTPEYLRAFQGQRCLGTLRRHKRAGQFLAMWTLTRTDGSFVDSFEFFREGKTALLRLANAEIAPAEAPSAIPCATPRDPVISAPVFDSDLIDAFRFHRQAQARTLADVPGYRVSIGGVDGFAAVALRMARNDVQAGRKRYPASDEDRPFNRDPMRQSFHAASPSRERGIESPEEWGLRFCEYASDVVASASSGYGTSEDFDETMRGVVYQLPTVGGVQRFVPCVQSSQGDGFLTGFFDEVQRFIPKGDNHERADDREDVIREAAKIADHRAEEAAEKESEYQNEFREADRASNAFTNLYDAHSRRCRTIFPAIMEAERLGDMATRDRLITFQTTSREHTDSKLLDIIESMRGNKQFVEMLSSVERSLYDELV